MSENEKNYRKIHHDQLPEKIRELIPIKYATRIKNESAFNLLLLQKLILADKKSPATAIEEMEQTDYPLEEVLETRNIEDVIREVAKILRDTYPYLNEAVASSFSYLVEFWILYYLKHLLTLVVETGKTSIYLLPATVSLIRQSLEEIQKLSAENTSIERLMVSSSVSDGDVRQTETVESIHQVLDEITGKQAKNRTFSEVYFRLLEYQRKGENSSC